MLESAAWTRHARLWLVLDREAAKPRRLTELAELAAMPGGVDAVVFRHKRIPFTDVLDEAQCVRAMCRQQGVPFVLSHALEFINELQPDGVHLSASAPELAGLRRSFPSIEGWGSSTHSVAEAKERLAQGYNYCFLGPVYATPNKLGLGNPLGPQTIEMARGAGLKLEQIVWIGGINTANALQLAQHGVRRAAVIGAVHEAADPQRAAAALRSALDG